MAEWKYCVVGNIAKEHINTNGNTRNRTITFPEGRKVYISRELRRAPDTVTVLGLNLSENEYVLERVPLFQLENIRCQKISSPDITAFMCDQTSHFRKWWDNSEEDHFDALIYAGTLQALSSPFDEPEAEWLYIPDDGSTLLLCPYVGRAWEVGKQIIASYGNYSHPYMNGYCWSSMIKYYLRSKNASQLLHEMEISPEEHVCVFHAHSPNNEAIRQLAIILRSDITLLPEWLIKSDFDEWDDW